MAHYDGRYDVIRVNIVESSHSRADTNVLLAMSCYQRAERVDEEFEAVIPGMVFRFDGILCGRFEGSENDSGSTRGGNGSARNRSCSEW